MASVVNKNQNLGDFQKVTDGPDIGKILMQSRGGQGVGAGLDFQLPSGYYVNQKMPIRILSPVADIGGDDSQYWRHATPDDDYVARICVQGGSAPFRVTLDQAPSGMVVGETMAQSVDGATGMTLHEWDEDYMVVSWPKASIPASGTYTVQFTVTGQDGMTSSVTYTVTCSASKFVWIDATATDDTGAGTYADPLKTFPVGLWKSSDADTTYAGKIAKFKAGTYSIYEAAPDSSPVLNRTNKPFALMAEVGAAVSFDTSRGHFRTTTDDGGHGLCVYGIDFNGSRTDLSNNRLFNLQNISDNQIWWKCSVDNTTIGTNGNDNPAFVFHGNDTTRRQNICVVDCELRSGAAFQLWVGFSHDGVLVERAHANNYAPPVSNGSPIVTVKDTCSDVTVRYTYGVASLSESPIQVMNQGVGSTAQEVCYNRLVVANDSPTANVVGVIDWNRQNEGTDMHDYRNSIVAPDQPAWDFNTSTEGVNFSLSLYYSPDGVLGASYAAVAPNTLSLLQTDFDAAGKLAGANRGAYLGQHGAEIAGPAV